MAAIDAVAVRTGSTPIHIDGVLSDPAWGTAPVVRNFRERSPQEGAVPTHHTAMQVVFDENALYVAIRADDPEPSHVVGLLTRRDDLSPSDWVSVLIDSFHDRRTAFEFGVNAAGVKYDRYWYDDTNSDNGWDAVWDVAVRRTSTGWQAEFRIPFSQLRFRAGQSNVLGFAVVRTVAHINETSTWPLLARSASGYVSSFGELRGVAVDGSQKRLELIPYAVSEATASPGAAGNPLVSSPAGSLSAGLDLRYRAAPGLTLTGTVNPDFGQVEADPAVVNLGAFETFFAEQRPFFVEGSGNFSFHNLFYSRRIGRAPHRVAGAPAGGFATQPTNTTILGAAKLTGRVGHYSVGALGAVTGAERARLTSGPGAPVTRTPVEPATTYAVGRVSREFADNSRVSVMLTTVKRRLPAELDFLPSSAVTGGADADWRLGHGQYSVTGFWAGSEVRGSAAAIDLIQRSTVHSFQRPDARHLTYDPAMTTLAGHSGSVGLSKIAGTRTLFNVNAGYRSPGYETNDLGYQPRADEIWQNAWLQIKDETPSRLLRTFRFNVNQWAAWNFDGDRREFGGNVNAHWTFVNSWSSGGGVNLNRESFDDRLTRGGPGGLVPGNLNGWVYVESDDRRRLSFSVEEDWFTDRHASSSVGTHAGTTLRLGPALSVRVTADVSHNHAANQWVTNIEPAEGASGPTHYVFGRLDQTTVGLSTRVSFTIRPTISLQVYAQPFVSAGAYDRFTELVDGRAATLAGRYAPYAYDGRPDFNFESFRTTNVLRWEYRPGSTLFVVWQQGRQATASRGDFAFGRDFSNTFGAPATNVLLVKVSRWLNF